MLSRVREWWKPGLALKMCNMKPIALKNKRVKVHDTEISRHYHIYIRYAALIYSEYTTLSAVQRVSGDCNGLYMCEIIVNQFGQIL